MNKKVSIIGAGNVGATTAQYIAEDNLADITLIDIVAGTPQGKALDLMEAAPLRQSNSKVTGSNDYAETKDSDIVVITAGLARKPGMSRDDLLEKNSQIMKAVVENVVQQSPECILIIVTNPLDIMTYLAMKTSGFAAHRVFGMAGVLDSARMRAFVAMELSVPVEDTEAMVLGGHGDSMVPLPRLCTVSGKPISELLAKEKVDQIVARTRKAGGESVAHLKTGSAFYSTAASITEMVTAIINDKKQLLPCAAYLQGEYGINDIYLGVPVILGAKGIEKIAEIELTEEEKTALHTSANAVKNGITKLKL